MPSHPERVRRHYGLCGLCGYSTLEGQHQVDGEDDDDDFIVCRVPMWVQYPRYLGRISSEPSADAAVRHPPSDPA